ncbi:Antiviral helicase ski2 [Blastocladiella emersonii ATCC 22665]|nr:Antiviral helicase ski2 [Blastocladiella emersonii ATCC 22665]
MTVPEKVVALEGTTDDAVQDSGFAVQQIGLAGEFRLVPTSAERPVVPATNLPLGLGEDYVFAHDIRSELESEFLTPPASFPAALLDDAQYFPPAESFLPPLSSYRELEPVPSPLAVLLQRDVLTGAVTGFAEVESAAAGLNTSNSMSMKRCVDKASAFVRGKSGNVPFMPGGLDLDGTTEANQRVLDPATLLDNGGKLFSVPPGFERGLVAVAGDDGEGDGGLQTMVDLVDVITSSHEKEQAILDHLMEAEAEPEPEPEPVPEPAPAAETEAPAAAADADGDASSLEEALDVDVASGDPTATSTTKSAAAAAAASRKTEWAHVMTDPMDHFATSVPRLAHDYPFELDLFQKQAVYRLERGDSVFVAAHTSAGKTVVAEYAIALAKKHMTRVIYTSPIKALSNQKFRDFSKTFDDVGILTGDVQINPEASCLIMTTEILRSMLYRGADLIRDVEYVVFDEIHYIESISQLNDSERGVVWEEVIIMLPAHIQIILLSATVPNTREFADWVGRTKKKDIYVISTQYRPVPLEHHLYVPSAKQYFKFVDAKKNLLGKGIKDANDHILGIANQPPVKQGEKRPALVTSSRGGRGGGANGRPGKQPPTKTITQQRLDRTTWSQLIGVLQKKDLLPVTTFVFSKKKCDEYADCLNSLDLLTASEKSEVHVFLERSLCRLRPEDRELPQLVRMREMLRRGIAVHHGGLLPLVKEVIEMLFARTLVKVLFATETFAMGVNMPTRCVVFASTRKHDGTSFRNLLPGEYTQMSGRAGRRGLDETGTVIQMCLDSPDLLALQHMTLGPPTKLQSQFRLTYNMILNLLRVETLQVEDMMKRSFSENSSQRMLPDVEKEFNKLQSALRELPALACLLCSRDLADFYSTCAEIVTLQRATADAIMGSAVGAKALAAGRLVVINTPRYRNHLAVVLSKQRSAAQNAKASLTVLVLVERGAAKHASSDASTSDSDEAVAAALNDVPLPVTRLQVPAADVADGRVVVVQPGEIALVLAHSLASAAELGDAVGSTAGLGISLDAVARHAKHDTAVAVQVMRKYAAAHDGSLREFSWSKLRDLDFQEKYARRVDLMRSLAKYQCAHCPDLVAHYAAVHAERTLADRMQSLTLTLSSLNLELLPEYHTRMDVLMQLGYVDPRSKTVQLKGRVACEINNCDELLLTELILNNFFADLDLAEVVAVLSVFLFQEKTDMDAELVKALTAAESRAATSSAAEATADAADDTLDAPAPTAPLTVSRWPARMLDALRTVRETARRVVAVQEALGVPVTVEGYLRDSLKYGLVEVVYEWARGLPFKQIMGLTSVAEGSIVRCIVRLEETCREIKDAARLVGDGALYVKMDAAAAAIKRDIVFCGSLYL